MKLLSFDVGIKNLSFCILELINNELTINKWEVVDLCNEKIRCIETVDNRSEERRVGKECRSRWWR